MSSANKKTMSIPAHQQFEQMIRVLGQFFEPALGPFGLDKMIFDEFNNDLMISNDGTTLLKNLETFLEPTLMKEILRWGKNLATTEGNGVKSFYILLGELLTQCIRLEQQGIPRQKILKTIDQLKKIWRELRTDPKYIYHSTFESEKSKNYAMSAINTQFMTAYLQGMVQGKLSPANADHLIQITIQALEQLGDRIMKPNFDLINECPIELIPGALVRESTILEGRLISKEPTTVSFLPENGINDARILLISQKLYLETPEAETHSHEGDSSRADKSFLSIQVDTQNAITDFQNWRKKQNQDWFTQIQAYHPNVIVTLRGVDTQFEQLCVVNKILLVRRAKQQEFDGLAIYLDIEPVEDVKDIQPANLGTVDRLYYHKIGRNFALIVKKYPLKHTQKLLLTSKEKLLQKSTIGTVLLGGSVWYVCQETERFFKKLLLAAIEFCKNPRTFLGGGNLELELYLKTTQWARTIPSVEGYCLSTLAEAYLCIPRILCTNAGMDSLDCLPQLKHLYLTGNTDIGINGITHTIESMRTAQIYDSYSTACHLFEYIFEILTQILRIDSVIKVAKKTFTRT